MGSSKRRNTPSPKPPPSQPPPGVRIIGGKFRGRRLAYSGDERTRPMKDRVREAVFNLIGTEIAGKHAIDLFAGTGALALESLSRGALRATAIEQHFPTAALIESNAKTLQTEQLLEVVPGNTFLWWRKGPALGETPWAVFCSPPYEFYVSRAADMLGLIGGMLESAPPQSLFVVEADERFDFAMLPDAQGWDVRTYAPAVVGIYRKENA